MSEGLVALLVAGVVVLVVAVVRHRLGRATTVLVSAEPEDALLSSAAALRHLGARITRYDTERGTLEARGPGNGVLHLQAARHEGQTTRVRLRGDAPRVIRRFRGAISA